MIGRLSAAIAVLPLAVPALGWLAAPPGDSDPSTGQGPEWGKAAPIGLLIILLMGAALFLLIKSMNRNLRKVPASFDPPPDADQGTGPGSTGTADDAAVGDDVADGRPGISGADDAPTADRF